MWPPIGWWISIVRRATVVLGLTLALGTGGLQLCERWPDLLGASASTIAQAIYISGFVTVASLAGLVTAGGVAGVIAVEKRRQRRLRRTRSGSFVCRLAGDRELERLWAFWHHEFGDDIADVSAMKAWHARNSSLFWVLHEDVDPESDGPSDRYVGSFTVIPIYAPARRAFENERLSAAGLQAKDIAPPKARPSAVYIGGILASAKARGETVARLEEKLLQWRQQGLPIFARAVSKRGLALLKGHGFRPVNPSACLEELRRIYKLSAIARPRVRGKERGNRLLKADPVS